MKVPEKLLSSMIFSGVMVAIPGVSEAAATPVNPTGPYVGGSIGQFNLDIDHLDDVNNAVQAVTDSDDNAWKVFAGYRFLPYLGVEAAYIDFGSPGDRFDASGSDGNYKVEMSGFAPSLIGRAPLGPVELFAKIGQYY